MQWLRRTATSVPLDSGSCKVSQGRTLNAKVMSRVPPLTAKPRATGESWPRAASYHRSGEAEMKELGS